MKKNVIINIKGTQSFDDNDDIIELMTVGSFSKRGGSYYISYDETEATGFDGSKTTLKVDGDNCVTMSRTGNNRSQLIIEKGTRHQCSYDTAFGNVMMGVFANKIESNLSDSGGDLKVKYTLDFNASMASENELLINVKECKPTDA